MTDLNHHPVPASQLEQRIRFLECRRDWFLDEDVLAAFDCRAGHGKVRGGGHDNDDCVTRFQQIFKGGVTARTQLLLYFLSPRLTGLEDVDRRLPIGRTVMEELAAQAVGPLHRRAGLRPHQCIELAFRHDRLRAGSSPVSAAANMGSRSRVGRSARARLPQLS